MTRAYPVAPGFEVAPTRLPGDEHTGLENDTGEAKVS